MEQKITSCRILTTHNRKVLLIHRRKEGKEYWVFPGGHLENGETSEEASKRELLEEAGLEMTKILKVILYDQPQYDSHECVVICKVKYEEPKLGGPEAQRNSESNWYNPEWADIKFASTLKNLYPEPVRDIFKKMYDHVS